MAALIAAAFPVSECRRKIWRSMCVRLKLKLQKAGYKVVMTRDTDVFVPLASRVAIANSYPNAIFICIHFNSATRSGANGIETYYLQSRKRDARCRHSVECDRGAPSENRGIRRRGYYVLRKTTIPGVLVECGFLTNPTEAHLVLTADYREKLAEEILRGIQGKAPLVVRAPASQNYPAATEMELQPFNLTWEREPISCASRRNGARDDLHTPGKRNRAEQKRRVQDVGELIWTHPF